MKKRSTVLILDDDSSMREYLRIVLDEGGYNTLEAASGDEALRILETKRPDLVMSDILMPRMDGYEFVRQLRSRSEIAGTLVMFHTATYNDTQSLALARGCGVSHILQKPLRPTSILEAVAKALDAEKETHEGAAESFEGDHRNLLMDKLYEKVSELEASNRALRESEARLHELAGRLQAVREEERTRVARQLHDELGSSLTALKMNCAWTIERAKSEDVQKRLRSSMDLIDETILVVRQLSTELRPGILDIAGLAAAIEWQAEEFQARSAIQCDVSAEGGEDLDSTRATEVFRVFQEALTNIARHAGATRIAIDLKQQNTDLVLNVYDNGKGATDDEINGRHALGILGMRERMALIGGSLSVHGKPGEGTSVMLRVPHTIQTQRESGAASGV